MDICSFPFLADVAAVFPHLLFRPSRSGKKKGGEEMREKSSDGSERSALSVH